MGYLTLGCTYILYDNARVRPSRGKDEEEARDRGRESEREREEMTNDLSSFHARDRGILCVLYTFRLSSYSWSLQTPLDLYSNGAPRTIFSICCIP